MIYEVYKSDSELIMLSFITILYYTCAPYIAAFQLLFLEPTFACMSLITDIFNYTANNLSICMDFAANIGANRVIW